MYLKPNLQNDAVPSDFIKRSSKESVGIFQNVANFINFAKFLSVAFS